MTSAAERVTFTCCPNCGWRPPADEVALERKLEELRLACSRGGITIGLMGTVTESDAARLLDRKPGTLRNWRYGEGSLSFVMRNGRVRYALADLANWLIEHDD